MNVLILLDVIKIPKEGCNIGYRLIVTSKEKLEEDGRLHIRKDGVFQYKISGIALGEVGKLNTKLSIQSSREI